MPTQYLVAQFVTCQYEHIKVYNSVADLEIFRGGFRFHSGIANSA